MNIDGSSLLNSLRQITNELSELPEGSITQEKKGQIESSIQKAAKQSKNISSLEELRTIQSIILVLNKTLQSEKVQRAFENVIQTPTDLKTMSASAKKEAASASAETTQAVLRASLASMSEDISRELKLAELFTEQRIKDILHIAEAGGSLQAYDVLTLGEYQALEEMVQKSIVSEDSLSEVEKQILQKIPNEVRSLFSDQIQSLEKRIQDFIDRFPSIEDPGVKQRVSQDLKELQEIELAILRLNQKKIEGKGAESDSAELQKLELRKAELKPTLEMIVAAKNFMRKVMSEEGEGSWLDIFSFITGASANELLNLANIEAISRHQSAQLDDMINEALWKEHLENKPESGKPLQIVIEGAGPNGLFTALQHFLAGADVMVVNERGERYVRNQIVDLDPKWAAQLRYFMGSKFDELFIGENAIGRYVEDGHYLRINTKNLEDALKERMVEIAAFAQEKEEGAHPFNLLYEASFKEIQFPTDDSPDFKAKLEAQSRPSADAARFNQALIDAKAAQLLNSKYAGRELEESIMEGGQAKTLLERAYEEAKAFVLEDKTSSIVKFLKEKHKKEVTADEQLIPHEQKKISAKQYAILELEGKVPELRSVPLPFMDCLVCCGGAGDQIRNRYLGLPEEETVAKSYGVAVFVKGDKFANQRYLPPGKEGRFYETMADLKPHIENQHFDDLISSSTFLSEGLRKKYANLSELILRGPVEDEALTLAGGKPNYRMDDSGKYVLGTSDLQDRKVQLRVFENKLTFYTGAETAEGLSLFLEDLEREKKSLPPGSKEAAKYDALKAQIDRKWFASIAYKYITEGHPERAGIINMERSQDPEKLNFDPVPVNTSTFPVVQYAVKTAAKEFKVPKFRRSLIATVLGDARASPHFYSGSGMSTGRTGIENSATLIRDFHRGVITKEELVSFLDSKLDKVKLQVLEKGKHFVKKSPPEKKAAVACAKMCDTVNELCKMITKKPLEGEYAYQIERTSGDVTPQQPQFLLQVKNKEGAWERRQAEVGSAGGIIVDGKTYDTVLDAVIATQAQ